MARIALDVDRMYRDHGHMVLRRAKHILGNDPEAREVLQEVFMSLVEDPHQFDGRSSATTFLYSVTTNACLNRLRSTRRRAELVHEHYEQPGSAAAGPDDALAATELLVRLPERLARVAVYYFIDEMTHDEIATILGLSRRQIGNLVADVLAEARRGADAA